MEIPPWIINPFDETEVENVILKEELLELSTDEELKVTFKTGYQKFWLQAEISEKYSGLWGIVEKLQIAFPSLFFAFLHFAKRSAIGFDERLVHYWYSSVLAIGCSLLEIGIPSILPRPRILGTCNQLRPVTFNRWSLPPMDIHKPGEVTSALSTSWVGKGYLMDREEFAKLIYDRINVLTARTGQIIPESYYMTPVEEETDTISNYIFNVKRMENAYNVIVDASALLEKSVRWQWDWKGIIYYKLLLPAKTINSDLYWQELMRLKQEIEKKRPVSVKRKDKEGRILAREFLAKLDTKSLSFKLLGIVDVGVRLPVQCLSLTLTCLIILLQFGKLVENLMWAK
ncbi:hypothetical protein EVAR_17178_1 [Eumeta japonica]|uniref:Uncharacterized protein n=1 Tax=Eumeta variegata TaxID=151549 RepID=A0A4C1UAA9_EUMVA|nr:hypothetical protein EVAR_17178_1 [Eumeta japonica]